MVVAVALFVISFAARVVTALLFGEPIYPDAYYYALVARELAAGHGFQLDYIWNFVDVGGRLPAQGELPIPSNAHWMPLAAVIQVPFIWLLGPTAPAAALPFWIIGAAVAPLTYLIGRDAGMARWQAGAAGLLLAVPGWVAPYLGQTDNFSVFMLLGALALWLCARGLRGDRRSFAIGGVVVGLAFLARNDGVLLGVPFALAFGWDVLRRPRGSRIGWVTAAACLLGFVIVVAPWLWRQLDVFGSVSPSAASGRILFIRDYRELYSVSSETTLSSFLEQGIGPLLMSRLDGLRAALTAFATGPLLIVLTPLLLIGAWRRRRDLAFIPWLVYALTLFAFAAIVSAVHVPHGTFMHSAVALVPHAYLLALLGLAALVRWVAARRPTWDAPRATRIFTVMLVVVCLVVASAGTLLTVRSWHAERDSRVAILDALAAEARPGDIVMSPDPGAYRYFGGWRGVVTPEDPLPVIEETLRRYDVRWLALERAHMVEALGPVLAGEERPAWLSDPLVVSTPPPSPEAADDGDVGPAAALFAVCLGADHPRCPD
jgi:4-amino-4-deoxy-L-arabinose transferase-like glycosyltransferase